MAEHTPDNPYLAARQEWTERYGSYVRAASAWRLVGIVSLSLALGLSGMASHNVRVDSLFLDEGFGTLDEEALDTALETLAHLQQEGKLIGIISHVTVLQERISTRIQVIPRSGGRSVLAGPGCRHCQ